ncbi:MAG: DUF3788 domain-containing protein [bacterium]
MEELVFNQKEKEPTENDLIKVMGKSYPFRKELISFIEENFGSLVLEWKYYGQKNGWAQKYLLKKRNLFFSIPHKDSFRVGFIFGDKAVEAIEQSGLPTEIIDEIKNAKKYAEGRGIRLDIKNKKVLDSVKKLVKIKIEN